MSSQTHPLPRTRPRPRRALTLRRLPNGMNFLMPLNCVLSAPADDDDDDDDDTDDDDVDDEVDVPMPSPLPLPRRCARPAA